MLELTEELSRELREKYNPEGSTLRKAQLRMVEMLQFIDKVCKENAIEYWLDSGTLLGAVRHGGFIPWDDDVDIVMPEKEYKRFRKLMQKDNPSVDYILQTDKTDRGYFAMWPTLVDSKSEYVWNSNIHKFRTYRGLQVDIFVVTDVYNKKIDDFLMPFHRDMVDHALDIGKSILFVRVNHILAKCMSSVAYFFGNFFDKHKGKLFQKYGSFFTGEVHDEEDVYPLQRMAFEGIELNVPSNCPRYLEDIYGADWHLIPEENSRQTHCIDVLFK